jgi:MFS family permease
VTAQPTTQKKTRFWEKESPFALTVFAAVLGLVCVLLSATALVMAVKVEDWAMTGLFAGLTVFCVWAMAALLSSSLSPDLRVGSRVGLLAFLFGAVLTLFEHPLDVFSGDLADISGWQGLFWAIGALLAVFGLYRERRHG